MAISSSSAKIKAHLWTHPDLDEPVLLHPDKIAPIDLLGPAMDEHLFKREVVMITTEELMRGRINSKKEDDPIGKSLATTAPKSQLHSGALAALKTATAKPPKTTIDPDVALTEPFIVAKPVPAPVKLTKRSPIWRKVAAELLANEINYGSFFPTSQMEKALGMKRDDVRFAFAIYNIRGVLMQHGFYLTSRGQKGEQLIVVPASQHAEIMLNMSAQASRALQRGIILGTKTSTNTLSAEEKRRHESVLEKLAHKSALMKNSDKVWKAVEGKVPELLEA